MRIPSIFNNDLAVFKNFQIGESRAVQLRWEMYNIFNHANFDDIDGTMTFGVVQSNPSGAACTAAGNTCTASLNRPEFFWYADHCSHTARDAGFD